MITLTMRKSNKPASQQYLSTSLKIENIQAVFFTPKKLFEIWYSFRVTTNRVLGSYFLQSIHPVAKIDKMRLDLSSSRPV